MKVEDGQSSHAEAQLHEMELELRGKIQEAKDIAKNIKMNLDNDRN